MNNDDQGALPREQTPVDDVRRVREQLDQEANGDIKALARRAREVASKYYAELGLTVIEPDARRRRNGTDG